MATPRRPSLVLLVVLGAALASGAAASLLLGSTATQGPTTGTAPLVILPESVVSYVLLGFALLIVGYWIYMRVMGRTAPAPRRPMVTVLFSVLLAIVFIVTVHTLYVAGLLTFGGSGGFLPPGHNATPPGNGSGGGGSSGGLGGLVWSPSVPAWLPFAIVAAVVIVVVAVAIPQFRSYLEDRRGRGTTPVPSADPAGDLRRALAAADQQLAGGKDPRSVILALYASVLEQVTRMVGSVELETPEEIRANHLVRLGIRPASAEVLTRLFEEARYSSHALEAIAAETARSAVREALADLARRPAAHP